jgi:positive phototaxis protein PixI
MNTSALTVSGKQPHSNFGESYLKFQLDPQTSAVFSMNHTQEVVAVPVQSIAAMPNMPGCILGLMNRRSRVLWVIDLAHMLGLQPLDTNARQYNVVIIRVGSVVLGLVVQSVKGAVRLMPEQIRSPLGQVSTGLIPYLRGCILQQGEILLVLDAEAIVQSSIFHNN